MEPAQLEITVASAGDAGEILTLQRAAYVTEAQIHDDVRLPPLTQTLEDLRSELDSVLTVKALIGGRLIGAVRLRISGETGHIGRLVVAPDLQGRGIGTALMHAVEQLAPREVERFELFTGRLSGGNLRLYQRLGYRECRRQRLSEKVELVFLEKHRL